MTRSVLMVAYYYPPRGGGGVQRTVKFAQYLPAFGVRPVVLTADTSPKNLTDTTFASARDVVRVPFREPGRLLGRLYEYLRFERISGWARPAIKAALQTAHEQGIELVYSTASPYTNHIVARAVARELGLPWIVDFRDLWTTNPLYRARTRWIGRQHIKAEQSFYQEATRIIVTSPSQKRAVVEDFGVNPDKLVIITNGFDPSDLDIRVDRPSTQPHTATAEQANKITTIGYLGSFYGEYRPDDVLLALRFIKHRWPQALNDLRLRFIGDYDRRSREILLAPDLADIISVEEYVPHGALARVRAGLSAYFLYLPALGDRIKGMIPQKVFEYMATRKPLFAVVPPSDVSDLLSKHNAATLAPAGDPIGIARALLVFIEKVRAGTAPTTAEPLTEYDRKVLTKRLAAVIKEVI